MTSTDQASTFADATYGALFDILPSIFHYALPSYVTLSNIPLPSPHRAPLNVSHVCRLWRQIALTTPNLWSTLRFDVDDCITTWNGVALRSADRWGWEIATAQRVTVEKDYYESRYERKKRNLEMKLEWMQIWLARSGGEVPLDLCVSIPEFQDLQRLGLEEYDDVARRVKLMLRALIEQRRRWRDVKMDVHLSMLLDSEQPDLGSGSPSLEDLLFNSYSANVEAFPSIPAIKLSLDNLTSAQHLSIRFYAISPYRDAQLPAWVYLDVTSSTKLRSIELRGPWPRLRHAKSELAADAQFGLGGTLSGLKRVEIASGYQFSLEQLISFLSSAGHSIEEIVGVIPYTIGSTSSSSSSSEQRHIAPILLPNLRTLVLTPTFGMQHSGTQIACELLSALDAPRTETLQIALPQRQEDAEGVGKAVLEFLSRAGANAGCAGEERGARSLRFTGTLFGDWLVKALPALPNLRTVELQVSYESEEAVHSLLAALSSPTLGSSLPPCPLLEQISIGNATLSEDIVASFLDIRTSPNDVGTLGCATFKQCRFVGLIGGGFGRGRGAGDGMGVFLRRREVKGALGRGLKVVFA